MVNPVASDIVPDFGFAFEITAKIETGKLDGTLMFNVQGRLALVGTDVEQEPMNFALPLDEERWRQLEVGDQMLFPMNSKVIRPSLSNEIN